MVHIDYHKFRQVVSNLIGNALKFTPKGGNVTILLSLDNARNRVRVDVIDTGVGIAQVRYISFSLYIRESNKTQMIHATGKYRCSIQGSDSV